MNEAETGAEHIDPVLRAAAWGVVEGSRIRRESQIIPGRTEGWGRRGKPLRDSWVKNLGDGSRGIHHVFFRDRLACTARSAAAMPFRAHVQSNS